MTIERSLSCKAITEHKSWSSVSVKSYELTPDKLFPSEGWFNRFMWEFTWHWFVLFVLNLFPFTCFITFVQMPFC